jgi:murein DD-endopeptidase MepM/ murein hydrolase activator NlpD
LGADVTAAETVGHRARRPARRAALLVAGTLVLALLCCGGSAGAFFLAGLGGDDGNPLATTFGCGEAGLLDFDGQLPTVDQLGEAQMRNAATIVEVGVAMEVPPRGWVVAIATALQESSLSNLPYLGKRNDHDSVGLFQQRPSQGWGTPAQLQDPEYASRKFYQKLVRIKDWSTMPLTVAAQKVQRSAYPDAYAKHEPTATEIVNLLANGAARAAGGSTKLSCTTRGEIAASGWTVPVLAPLGSGFRTGSRPGHDGVDLSAKRDDPIFAAAAGRVTHIECDNDGARWYSCDDDGSPDTPGCGWYMEITHAGNVITRYCHMLRRPSVFLGQSVAPGQEIGRVGTSGHSSGPHLHFEVHLHGDRSANGAVDPASFMRKQGAPLGGDE